MAKCLELKGPLFGLHCEVCREPAVSMGMVGGAADTLKETHRMSSLPVDLQELVIPLVKALARTTIDRKL